MPTISLELAGVPFLVETQSTRLVELYTDYYRYYSPSVIDGLDSGISDNLQVTPKLRLILETVEELPAPYHHSQPGWRLISRTGVLELWERSEPESEQYKYLFQAGCATFQVDPRRALIRGKIAPTAFSYPHILANTYSMFPVLLVLRQLGLYHLHAAAAISPRGRVWLIPGSQRSGKTTIVTALGIAGWRPVSDDSLLLISGAESEKDHSGEIVALKKYFHLGNDLLSRWQDLDVMVRGHSYLDRTCVDAIGFFGQPGEREEKIKRVDHLLMPRITGKPQSRAGAALASDGLL
ncbi:MAG: hypothetical protein EBU88_15570, partial [Acidobacteria bacterium]|nr:hypothetical protein [Acidobacteriota bacterium]